MAEEWLQPGEEIIDSWPVYLGEESPTSAKITGKLYATNRHVHFAAGLSLREGAGAALSNRIQAFVKSESHIAIPYADIGEVVVTKKLFLKTLRIVLKSGEPIDFRFGAASPKKALEIIQVRK